MMRGLRRGFSPAAAARHPLAAAVLTDFYLFFELTHSGSDSTRFVREFRVCRGCQQGQFGVFSPSPNRIEPAQLDFQ